MSDGSSDIALDEKRNERYAVYAKALKEYLKDSTEAKFEAVVSAAMHLDELNGWGYSTGPTSESVGLETWLAKLTAGDASTWVAFIKEREGQPDYEEFKALSPIHKQHENNWGEYI